jgi:hypothetical protein
MLHKSAMNRRLIQRVTQDFIYLTTFVKRSYIQGDQKVSVHLMIAIQKVISKVYKEFPASLQTFIDTRLALTSSVIRNSNYVIVVSD